MRRLLLVACLLMSTGDVLGNHASPFPDGFAAQKKIVRREHFVIRAATAAEAAATARKFLDGPRLEIGRWRMVEREGDRPGEREVVLFLTIHKTDR